MQLADSAIKLVHNGFLPSSMNLHGGGGRAASRAKLGLPADGPVVGAMMRLAPEKDPDLWLETAAVIASSRPDACFLLAGYGHGAIAEQLFQKATKLGFGHRLVMPGAVSDIAQIYSAMDVFLLSSKVRQSSERPDRSTGGWHLGRWSCSGGRRRGHAGRFDRITCP